MENIRYANAMAEVLYYLKGIAQKDIDKIPKKLIEFLKENASQEYQCQFDYTKPLKNLELLEETQGLIAMICYNYWCETKQQKEQLLKTLNENERKYQEELRDKYNPEDLFKKYQKEENTIKEVAMVQHKQTIFTKIINKIKQILFLKSIE